MLLKILCVLILSIQFLFIIYFIFKKGMEKGIEIGVEQGIKKGKTSFDPLLASGTNGIDIVNDFISKEFNKFFHNKLISIYEERGGTPVSNLLNELKNAEKLIPFISGFIALIEVRMSNELKHFFNKYYTIVDANDEYNENFEIYLTEWVNEKIRAIQSELIIPGTDGIMSTEMLIDLNNKLFLKLEYEIYKDMKIVSESNYESENKNKTNFGGNK